MVRGSGAPSMFSEPASSVTIIMPDSDTAASALPGDAAQKRLLVVDDEPSVRELLENYFTTKGYSVLMAATGEDAIRIAREQLLHLILLDYVLPDCDGIELLARMQNIKSRRPVILMTGFGADQELLERALQNGAVDCISKTSPLDQLLAMVESALAPSQKSRRIGQGATGTGGRAGHVSGLPATPSLQPELSRFAIQISIASLAARHPNLGNTATRAAVLAETVAPDLRLNENETQILIQAAAWHDLALVGWDRKLIDTWQRTPGKLMSQDWSLVRQHPIQSQQILLFSSALCATGEIVRAHHEHWDGHGFPDGLKGSEIPWLSRVLAVMLAYCDRLYPQPAVLNEIRLGAGKRFDAEAIDAVAKVAANFPIPSGAREVPLPNLAPGMILAEDLLYHDGTHILSKDQELTGAWINKIMSIHQATPLRPCTLIAC